MKDPATWPVPGIVQYIIILWSTDGTIKESATELARGMVPDYEFKHPDGCIIKGHKAIMGPYDPPENKRAVLMNGATGSMWNGTNPGFLYQQNSIRDAVTAAVHLNIFQPRMPTECMSPTWLRW